MTEADYWTAIMGPRSPERVVREFNLVPGPRRDLEEWVAACDAEAARMMGGERGFDVPAEWRSRVVDELEAVLSTSDDDQPANHNPEPSEPCDPLPEPARCACGAVGTWSAPRLGRHNGNPAWWATCRACDGRTVGDPIPDASLVWLTDGSAIAGVRS